MQLYVNFGEGSMRWRKEGILFFFWGQVNVLLICIKSIHFITSATFIVSLFKFSFKDLSVGESGVLMFPTIIL